MAGPGGGPSAASGSPQDENKAGAVRRVVSTLLHTPTVRVKELAEAPAAASYAEALRELFGLDPAAPAAVAAAIASTTVHFAEVSDAEIAAYVATGEPLQVAGAFTVDGLGGAFVTRIEGDHHNVVGVSLPLLRDLLAELGHEWTDLWTT